MLPKHVVRKKKDKELQKCDCCMYDGVCDIHMEVWMYENIDLTLLNRLLRLIVDHNIVNYMTARNNVVINYKVQYLCDYKFTYLLILQNSRLTFEDLQVSWEEGTPCITTLFHKDQHALACDKGWRTRRGVKQYQVIQCYAC
jgi:hypothetical protein